MPTNLPGRNLELFVEADALAGAGGEAVSSYTDLSGNNRHLVASSNQPTILTNAVNGKKSVVWDGTKNPLKWTGNLQIQCGFIVVKIDGNFTNYNGVLSSLTQAILIGNQNLQNKWFDFAYDFYEARLDDRIYPKSNAPAPINRYGIVFFRFWQSILLDGIQIGQDRSFADRKLSGSIPLVGIYNRGFRESEIRNIFAGIANSYQLPIENVFPFQGSKSDPRTVSQKTLSSVSISGKTKARVKDRKRKYFDAKFTSRRQIEVDTAEQFWDDYYPLKTFLYRDYNVIPPIDTIARLPIDSIFTRSGAVNNFDYNFSIVEDDLLSPPAIPPLPNAPPDQIAPSVAIISPAEGATVSGTFSIDVQAADNDGVVGVSYFVDGVSIGTERTVAPFSIPFDSHYVANGSHTITAVARDAAGNTRTSAPRAIIVENHLTVTLTAPAAGSSVSGIIQLRAAASSLGATIDRIEYYFGIGNYIGTSRVASNYSVNFDTAVAPNGSVLLAAFAFDTNGNASAGSFVTVTVNNGGGQFTGAVNKAIKDDASTKIIMDENGKVIIVTV